jgi:hypothetical protein
MSKEWMAQVAGAEAVAEGKQASEEIAHGRFHAVRAQAEAAGRPHEATETVEFREWIAARRATDEAWGAWAMAMDAKPATA